MREAIGYLVSQNNKRWSGRPGSNRRHPAWELRCLPLYQVVTSRIYCVLAYTWREHGVLVLSILLSKNANATVPCPYVLTFVFSISVASRHQH